jgi:hypothetical protein
MSSSPRAHLRCTIAFTQEFLSERGGARVRYVDKDTDTHAAFLALRDQKLQDVDQADPFWKVTPFVDFPGEYVGALYRFEWERERRVPRELQFDPDNVSFLFIPEDLHEAARESLQGRSPRTQALPTRAHSSTRSGMSIRWPKHLRNTIRRERLARTVAMSASIGCCSPEMSVRLAASFTREEHATSQHPAADV